MGIGGTPEGVIAACALRCLDGQLLGRLFARDDAERAAALEQGYDLDRVLRTEDLVSGKDIFFAATGVTDGELLRGVRYTPRRVLTQSLSMRSKSGAIRYHRRPPPPGALEPDSRGWARITRNQPDTVEYTES